MPPLDDDSRIDDDEFAAVLALTRSQEADRRERDAGLAALAGSPCPACFLIDTPLPGTAPLRLTLRRRRGRLFLDCPRRHEFERPEQIRLPK